MLAALDEQVAASRSVVYTTPRADAGPPQSRNPSIQRNDARLFGLGVRGWGGVESARSPPAAGIDQVVCRCSQRASAPVWFDHPQPCV